MKSNRKQSIIAGGLISSAGIFISKLIGIIYVIPLQHIVGEGNLFYYSTAFNIYSYILNIATAGIPFAIATLVAVYTARGDYKTTILIKKLSFSLMAAFGLISMLIVMLGSGVIARLVTIDSMGQDVIDNMRNAMIIISLALFIVPLLSALRGFYQGLKHMEVYALSQVLEQVSRVVFLLGAGSLIVYVFHQDQIWAVYFAILSAAVAALLAFIHLLFYDRKYMPNIRAEAKKQKIESNDDSHTLIKEIIFIAFPFLMVAILGYSDMIINTTFLSNALAAHGESAKYVTTVYDIVFLPVQKVMSIPMVLAPGFSAAIIPYITSSLAKKDYKHVRKNITECIESVLYIGIPISFCLFCFAKPVMYFMSNIGTIELNGEILQWFALEAFMSTIGPIFNALMMACQMQKLNIRNLGVYALIKLISTYPLIVWLGYPGMVLSSFISLGTCILLDIYALTKRFHIKWSYTIRKILFMCIGLIGIWAVSYFFEKTGFKGYGNGRIIGLLQLAVSGSVAVAAYCAITYFFQLPQMIFHIDVSRIIKKVKRK